jgi:hypothetical protein
MPAEAWVVIGSVVLAVLAGSLWWARQYDRTYQKHIDASSELHRRSLALIDRQEELLGRAESLMDRLEKQGGPA